MRRIDEQFEKTFGSLPEKVLQIGEGNFLRAFADWIVETANRQGVFNGSVVIAQPIADGLCEALNAQNAMYTVLMRGVENGAVVEQIERVTSVSRCINPYADYAAFVEVACAESLEVVISNTTEAGIAYREGDRVEDQPPVSFPAKLTALLYARFRHFGGAEDKGLLMLPVELIERNGDNLKRIVERYAEEWALGEAFLRWLNTACCFANTLVDRIVTGFPRDEYPALSAALGYEDSLLVTCEPFLFWVIECDKRFAVRFPVENIGLNILFTEDMTPYRTRKVRILNGAHTLSVLAAHLAGHDIVLDMMRDELFAGAIRKALFEEIIPTIDMPREELDFFAAAVLERFENPFIKHRLLDISLNSVSKFKARCLGSLLDYIDRYKELPSILCFGLAALIRFYRGEFIDGRYCGRRGQEMYEIRDDAAVLTFMCEAWNAPDTVAAVLGNTAFWGRDLTAVNGLADAVGAHLNAIDTYGVAEALRLALQP